MTRLVGGLRFIDLSPAQTSFLDEVISGLSRAHKELPAKYFYDERGSALFERICELPEYYPTRVETALMQAHSAEIAAALGAEVLLIEYGSGSGAKTRILIDALNPIAYVPIDISESALRQWGTELRAARPDLAIIAICADYMKPLPFPDFSDIGHRRKVVFFPGSTIGNLTPEEVLVFLGHSADTVGAGGAMLVGVDLKKDPALLHAAYNDAQGVTKAFNLNVLERINRVLGSDFAPDSFWHYAYYRPQRGRIEMHLISKTAQVVRVAGRRFHFRAGESIHTEISCKYEVDEFRELARQAGFTPERVWIDGARLFSIHLLRA